MKLEIKLTARILQILAVLILMAIGGYCYGKVKELTEIQCVVRSVIFMLVYVISILFPASNNRPPIDEPIKSVDRTQPYIHEPNKAL